MARKIDLHGMYSDDALRVFIQKYNAMYKKDSFSEIEVIHGYGSGFLDSTPVIKTKIRAYLSRNRDCVKMILGLNEGVTYIKPIKPLPLIKKKKTKKKR